MGKYFSCLNRKVTPNIYRQNTMFNEEVKYTTFGTNFINFDKRKSIFFKKNKSAEDISLLVDPISPLSRHSSRKSKSMDCLFSLI